MQWVTCNDASKLAVGQAQYSGLMTERGTFVDDILVHKISDSHYFLCVNAGNQDDDFAHIVSQNRFDAEAENSSARYSQLAIQGPRAKEILQPLTETALDPIRYYHFVFGTVSGVECLIARTGYTGEDGFEIYFGTAYSEKLWDNLLRSGEQFGLIPCGLGARNTLRLEAGMALYGHEIDDTTTPLEAGLGWICKLEKGDFQGRETLAQQKQAGVRRKLVGFEMLDKRIGRDGYPVLVGGAKAGRVTSGGPAPFLKKNIGMAYVPPEASAVGRRSKSKFADRWRRRKSCRCRFTSGRVESQLILEARCTQRIIATRKSTSGSKSKARLGPSASPTTRSTNWATWFSSSCRKSARK